MIQTLRKNTLNERGGAGLSATIAIAIVGACVFIGAQLIPIYWGHWNFEDDMKTVAHYAFLNYQGQVKEKVLEDVKRGLKEMGAEYKDKDVKITVVPEQKKISIDVYYTKTHKVPFFTNPLPFDIHVENRPL